MAVSMFCFQSKHCQILRFNNTWIRYTNIYEMGSITKLDKQRSNRYMSTFLYKIGNTAYRKPWHFVTGWLIILAIVVSLMGLNGIHVSSEMKIEGTESQRILDQLSQELPLASGGQGSIVFRIS